MHLGVSLNALLVELGAKVGDLALLRVEAEAQGFDQRVALVANGLRLRRRFRDGLGLGDRHRFNRSGLRRERLRLGQGLRLGRRFRLRLRHRQRLDGDGLRFGRRRRRGHRLSGNHDLVQPGGTLRRTERVRRRGLVNGLRRSQRLRSLDRHGRLRRRQDERLRRRGRSGRRGRGLWRGCWLGVGLWLGRGCRSRRWFRGRAEERHGLGRPQQRRRTGVRHLGRGLLSGLAAEPGRKSVFGLQHPAVLLGKRIRERRPGDEPAADDDLAQAAARLRLLLEGLCELRLGEQAGSDQNASELGCG
jgi:hypothetical protein